MVPVGIEQMAVTNIGLTQLQPKELEAAQRCPTTNSRQPRTGCPIPAQAVSILALRLTLDVPHRNQIPAFGSRDRNEASMQDLNCDRLGA